MVAMVIRIIRGLIVSNVVKASFGIDASFGKLFASLEESPDMFDDLLGMTNALIERESEMIDIPKAAIGLVLMGQISKLVRAEFPKESADFFIRLMAGIESEADL